MNDSLGFRELVGGVCVPQGFLAAGVAAGIKKSGAKDLALIVSEAPCHSAGVFTTNRVKAAPVLFCLQKIRRPVYGIVVNSGNANACTGKEGFRNAQIMAETASRATRANGNFLVCSTGRIGAQLPMKKMIHGIHQAAAALSVHDRMAAEAMMTTDTFAKQMAVEIRLQGKPVRIGGIAKGAGMIHPGMSSTGKSRALHATMLCFLTTDAVIRPFLLQECLHLAVAKSFNRIDVDGDMSTNDTVLLLANQKAGHKSFQRGSPAHRLFQNALEHLTLSLALMIVKDGEGISKIVTIQVTGAASAKDAERVVQAIGHSTLAKCSWCGEDPNWGRIFCAAGYSGAKLNPACFSIKYNDIFLVKNGLEIKKNLQKVRKIVKKPSFTICCDLQLGKHSSILYTTDLTEKYVELNKGE